MLKSLGIKILSRIFLLCGLILRPRKGFAGDTIKTILINRTDRLGDAMVSLPLLLELNKRFEVTVLTSEYNDFILKDFLKTKIFTSQPLSFLKAVKMISRKLFTFWRGKEAAGLPQYDLYLDLMGLRGLDVFLKVKEGHLCRYYADFNLGIWNILLDYSASGNAALFSRVHVLDSYRAFIKGCLGLDLDIPDYLDLGNWGERPVGFNVAKPYILVNISGFDKFRGPSPKFFAQLLNGLEFAGNTVIMDELGQPNLAEFKKEIDQDKVFYLEREYSIEELLHISKEGILYIGSDSGITQILEKAAHSFIFWGNVFTDVWRPYSKNPYTRKKIGGIIIDETRNSVGLMKKMIQVPVWCRPCFDIGCQKRACIEFVHQGGQVIARELNDFVRDIQR